MVRAQILVADRDPGFASGLAADLRSLGYAVSGVVSSSEEVLEKAEETRADLVILDVGLLQDGKKGSTAGQLRKRLPNLVYLVGEEEPQTCKQARITHSFDYLRRGCDSRELETIIDMALYRRKLEKKIARGEKARGRDRREADLLAERQRLYQVLDTLPAYVVLLDRDYFVPFANREFVKRFGAPEGRKCYDFLFGRTSPCPDCETYKVLQTKAPHEWEWTGPDGREYQIYDFPFPDIDGSPLILEMGVDVTVLKEKEAEVRRMAAALGRSYEEMEARVQDRTRDLAQANAALQEEVTERLWSEKKLKESEEQYRSLVALSPDAIAVYSQGDLVFINPAGAQLFGANHYQELVGKPALDLIHPEHREAVEHRLQRLVAAGGRTKLREIKILRLDGQAVDVEAAGVGIAYQGQSAVQVVLRDITARKRTEQELEHLASFPHLNPNPVLEADVSGNIAYANAASLRVLKKLGRKNQTRAFLPPDLDKIMTAAAETGETAFHRQIKIGEAFFSETIAFARESNVFHIYARDITQQKRAEKERQELLEKLQASQEELQVQNEELHTLTEELLAGNQNLTEAHEALREREAQLRTIFDNLAEGLVVADLEGQLFHWNPAAVAMHGFASLEEGIRRLPEFAAVFELSTVEDGVLPVEEWPLARILRGETLRGWEVHLRRHDTDWQRVFRYGGTVARDQEGNPLLAVVTVGDITGQKAAEKALRESREDLNRAQAVAHTGSWRLDVRKNELLWSDETYRIFGIPQGTPLTYEAFLAAVHPEDREYLDRKWTAALAGEPYDIEHRIVAGDKVKWVRERAELEFDAEGQLLGGFGTVQDITERKRGEEALKESEARYRSLFQNNRAVKLLIDPETGEIVDANPAACSFYGYRKKELTARKITDIRLDPPEQVFRHMQQVKAGKESHFFFKHRLADGEVRDVEVYKSLLQVHGRELLYSIIHDNTARKEAEDTLQASRDFLEVANRHSQMAPLLQDFVAEIKEHTGCEAVAIRILQEQGRIPYEAAAGFPEEFLASESPLSIMSDQCLCINVINGATDPRLPLYTPGSSCYINRFSHLLTAVPRELRGKTRNICHQFGYESVALVPIIFGGDILGLIHLADHRENLVPLSLVERLERIALILGTAINRVRAEEGLRRALEDTRQRQAEIAALLQATRAVLEASTFQEIARSIYDSCKDLIGASSGYIALLTADGQENEVLFLDTGRLDCRVDPSLPMPVRGLRAEAYQTGKTVYNNDYPGSDHARFLPPGHVGLDNVLFAPLAVRGSNLGLLGLGNKPGGFTENDTRLAAGFAELAAMALSDQRAEEERERLIRELEMERGRLQAIIASAPEAIVVADENGRILLTNPAADRLYAHPAGGVKDASSCALFQLCHADGTTCSPGNQPLLRSAQAGETNRNLEMVIAWPGGQRRDLLVNTAPLMDQHGSSSGAVGLFQDITNLKEAEKERRRLIQELDEQRMLLEAVLHQMPGGVAVMSAAGKLILANEQVEQIFRQPVPPDIGVKQLTKFKIFHPDGRPYRLEEYPLARALRQGETIIDEDIDFQRGDGSRGIQRASAAPIRDRHGDIMAGVVTFDDITERKQTEKEIQKLNVELGSRILEVSERTRQLEAANKELEAFSYSVSHDLRTPLRAIEGFARMLMEDHSADLDTEGIRLLNVIRSNTHIMGRLIDDLLALSRLGRREIKALEFDLGGMVTSVFGELQAQAPARRMQLILNPLSPAYGDRTLINQVVLNLLDNALKFTQPKEEAIIEVGGWTEGKEDIYFVKDNGVGFDMRYVDKIFGAFQRLHRGEDFAGTGVGLAIVQRIISRHGGRVWAAGKVGQGAVFYFALPRKGEGN